MFHRKLFPLALVLAAGCTASEPLPGGTSDAPQGSSAPAPIFLDLNGNQLYDAVDRDLDGAIDYVFSESSVANALIDAGICLDPALLFIDLDDDGFFDAIDLNCDGVPDVVIQTPPAPGDSPTPGDPGNPQDPPPGDGTEPPTGESCNVLLAIDGDQRRVECSSDAMGTTCACYRNEILVDSCTPTANQNACSVTEGCCDFGN